MQQNHTQRHSLSMIQLNEDGEGIEEEEKMLDRFRKLGDVMSFRTNVGCEMLLPPGKWTVKTVGVR